VAKIPSTHDGIIKSIKYQNDEICPVGMALIEIEVEEGGAAPGKKAEESSSSSSEEDKKVARTPLSPEVKASNHKALATPAVRSIAKKHSVDLSKVRGSGKDGRVMKEDILAFIDGKQQPEAPKASGATKAASISSSGDKVVKIAPLTGVKSDDVVKKLTGMKKAMTKTMTESRSIPFFTF
jgi:2-oxoisovalerate dehydrogenase E2 component (dihydrolipoyl transacylase)